MKYEIYSTIDSGYMDASLVFIKSFTDHNPNLKLNICCINFTPAEYEKYKSKLSFFKNVTAIPVKFTDPVDRINIGSVVDFHIYREHMHATLYKLKLFSEMTSDYVLYLDVDMLIRKNIASLLKEYTTDFAGRCYHEDIDGMTINAGVLIAKKGMPDLYKNSFDFFKKRKENPFPEEFYIYHSGFTITDIPAKYNYFRCNSNCELVKDPVIVHFCSMAKPFAKNNCTTTYCLQWQYTAAAIGYYIYFNEWYNTFDSIVNILSPEFIAQVNEAKQFYKHYIEISNRSLSNTMRFIRWK